MREKECQATAESLFVGGGEMGALLRSHDWSQTSLGSVETWSDSLKTAMQILLSEFDQAKQSVELTHTEALLRTSHDTFRHLVENSPFGVYVVDADFRLAQVSAGAQKVFENVRPLIGRNFAEVLRIIWAEPFASEAIALFQQTLEMGEPYHAPSTIERRRDVGEVESYDWKIERITLPDGRFGVVCHFYDLSQRQHYEAALRESEEQSRNILESITDAFFAVDENWRFTYVNQTAYTLVNRTPGDLIRKVFWEEFSGVNDSQFEQMHRRVMRDRVAESLTAFYPDHDRWYEVRSYPAVNGITIYFRNVTEQIQAEVALQESEERYRSLVAATSSIVWVAAGNGEILSAPAWETFTGQTPEQYRGWGWFEMVHPDDRETTTRIWTHGIEHKIPCEVEHRLLHRDGQYRHTITRAVPILDAAGNIREWVGTVTDITDRKVAEAALHDSEAQFRQLADAVPQLVWTAQPDGKVDYLNGRWLEYTGIPPQVFYEWGWQQIVHPDDLPNTLTVWTEALQTGEPIDIKHRYRRVDGQWRWHLVRGILFKNEAGQAVKWFGSCTDIHESEMREQDARFLEDLGDRLRVSENVDSLMAMVAPLLGQYLEASRCCFAEIDNAADRWTVSHDYTSAAELPSLVGNHPISAYPPDVIAAFRAGRAVNVTDTMTDPMTTAFYATRYQPLGIRSFVVVPLLHEGQWVSGLGVFMDVPRAWEERELTLIDTVVERTWNAIENLRLVAELQVSEARFRNMADNAPMMVWVTDTTGYCTYLSQSWYDFSGQTEATGLGFGWLDATHPDDRAASEATFLAANERQEAFQLEYRLRRQDGQYRTCVDAAKPWFGADGTFKGYIGSVIDIDDRIQAEAALRQSEERYRTLFESIDQGFCLLEVLFDSNDKAYDYHFVEINEAFEQQSGLVDAAGKTILELVPNFEPQWVELYAQVAKSGEAVRFEADVPSLNGIFDIYAVPSGAPGQNLVSALFTNITERKRREANLAFLAEVQDDCARLTTAEELMQTIGAKIGAYLNLSICAFVDVDEAQDQAIVSCCWHRADVPNLVGIYRISNFVSEEFYIAARAGAVVIVNDTNTDARTDAVSCATLNVQSFIHVPFLRDGQWKFLFNVYDSRPRNWREDEIELFSELANRIFQRLERARAEAAIHESEERLRLFVTASSDMMYRMSADWSEMHHLTGKDFLASTESPIRTWLEQYIPQAVQSQVLAAIKEAIRTKSPFELEHRVIQLDGTVGWTFSRAIPLLDAQNEIIEWFGAANNITVAKHLEEGRKQAEAEREQLLQRERAAREEAERANRIKDEFLAVLSHELRSPLNPILGWTRLLQNGKLDEARRVEALRTVERNAKLQSQLIEDLLDISRIMQGKLSLTAAPVNLPLVISAAVETVRLAAEAKHIQVTLDLDPSVSSISGDAARLQQVVWNLLTNAVKFTPNGGQVTVELRQIGQLAQIRVIDTGKGINPQFLPHVFEYFRQEDGSTTRKFGGLGLGLAIVRQIVEMHGGTVWAKSQGEGQGTTFIVQLPTMQQTALISSEPTPNQIDVEVPLADIQILLVDDEPDTREFQAFLLEQSGATVTAVASGLEALQALEQLIPDLLVSDIGMAEMDGYMLLQQIRLRQPNQGGTIPAIALTAYAAEIDQQRALQVGFQMHITKPVEPEALVKAIASLLERT